LLDAGGIISAGGGTAAKIRKEWESEKYDPILIQTR
jgi:hypothetical protein